MAGVVDRLARIEALAGSAHELTGAERREVLATLERVGGALTAARSAWLLAERDAGTSVVAGDPSFEASLARHGRTGLGAATRRVEQAQALAAMPAVAVAVRTGALPGEHLEILGQALAGASESVAGELRSPSGQAAALRLACAHPAPGFRRALARWVAERDPDRVEDEYQAQRRARYLHLTTRPDGTRISGLLDPVAGERLRRALEATGEAPSDDRTPEQARADALDALASTVLSMPSTGSRAAVRPHVSFLMREETFTALRSRRRSPGGSAGSSAAVSGNDEVAIADVARRPVPAATLEDGTPVAMSELARVLCDCEVTRIVVDAADEPVNLGRTARLYTGVQRRAVIARDRSCRWGDCDRAARWGEIHHIAWWDRDAGRTDLANGVLLCSFHHHEVHRHDARIERLTRGRPRGHGDPGPAVYRFTAPDGRVLAQPAGDTQLGGPQVLGQPRRDEGGVRSQVVVAGPGDGGGVRPRIVRARPGNGTAHGDPPVDLLTPLENPDDEAARGEPSVRPSLRAAVRRGRRQVPVGTQ
ncbi:DUF222 domain-containing protein [Cellulomonas sp.]|uniref:HNH endonuclease n=1 Tax=Cellulomonas sp. TaxID=40001 RepID=UPI001B263365|nr:DUF222 domain-containing protein [Cellulomonas sp.]MBO9556579.1 DUF222 domain-containing protein [Cellulomonas sp.]